MALTAQEQAELNQLQGMQSGQASAGLSTGEQAELAQLQQMEPDRQVGAIRQDQDSSAPLFEALRGKLPSQGPLPPAQRTVVIQREPFIGPNPAFQRESERRQAFQQLTEKGFDPNQIELTLKAQKVLEGPRVGRIGGGIGGAIATTALAGRLIPGPVDDAIILASLAAGGAGVGGVAGEAAQTAIEEERLIGGREALSAFANEAVTELGGRALAGGAKLVASPFIKKVVPEAAALVDDFSKVGGLFSATELDDRMSLRVGEAFSRGSIGGERVFQKFEEKQGKAVLAFSEPIIESIAQGIARQTPEEIGETFAKGISRPDGRVFNMLDELFNPLYKKVDDLTGTANVSTESLKKFAQKHLATDTRLNGQFLSPAGKSKLEKIIGLEEKLSFSDMRTLRSSFLKDARKMARDVDQSQSIIKQLSGVTDEAIFNPSSAEGATGEALNLLRNTNSLYKTAQQGLKTTFPESLAKRLLKNPSNVVKEVFPSNNPESIRKLRQSLVNPTAGPIVVDGKVVGIAKGGRPSQEGKVLWNQLRQGWLADAVDQASKEGVAKPKVLDRAFRKIGTKGLKEMFPEDETRASVKKIQSMFRSAGRKPPGAVPIIVKGGQVLGVGLMYQGAKEGDYIGFSKGAALTMGPIAFAKLATSPKGVKLLTSGFKLKRGSSALVPNAVRMVRLLRDIDKRDAKRRQNFIKAEASARQSKRQPTLEQQRGFGGRGF